MSTRNVFNSILQNEKKVCKLKKPTKKRTPHAKEWIKLEHKTVHIYFT